MFKFRQADQKGAVSMLTVIFLALLLTIITTSFVRLSITEQRQAIDDDLTTRAFYAAESGVEDAKRALSEYQQDNITAAQLETNPPSCAPADIGTSGMISTDLQAEYTCQLIDLTPASFQDDLDPWESVTIPLNGVSSFNSIRVEWHIRNSSTEPYSRHTVKTLPPYNTWISSNWPAMLRAAVFWHPNSSSFAPNQVSQSAMFLNPATSAEAANISSHDRQVRNGGCQASPGTGNYACSITISGLSSGGSAPTYYLRLQALYREADVQVTLLNNSTIVNLDEVQAVIDVTARAGDVFRRVEARVALNPNEFPFPDIALWSNTEICKNFTVTNNPAEYLNTCPWGP